MSDILEREAYIRKIEQENADLRREVEDTLRQARAYRDDYDKLCNELGQLGVDIPKLRAGKIKAVQA